MPADKTNSSGNHAEGAPQRKRRSFFQKYKSPIFFLMFVALGLLGLKQVADSGYFESHMEKVRRDAADRYLAWQGGLPNASVLPSGLIFSITRRGSGDRAPAAHEACLVHYVITFRFYELLEDTYRKGAPIRRAPADLIPGVSEAMQHMREGDRWFMIVPYYLAYNMTGNKELGLPSLVTLKYDFEMIKCPKTLTGKTSEEIDAYLAPYMKQSAPPKSEPIHYDDL